MARMEDAVRRGVVFDIKEMIIRDSFTVAVCVGLIKSGKVFQHVQVDVHQFLFFFNGKVIVGVKEKTNKTALSDIFNEKMSF